MYLELGLSLLLSKKQKFIYFISVESHFAGVACREPLSHFGIILSPFLMARNVPFTPGSQLRGSHQKNFGVLFQVLVRLYKTTLCKCRFLGGKMLMAICGQAQFLLLVKKQQQHINNQQQQKSSD